MAGAAGTNKVSGARSEALAEYVFGAWGPVLRGREDSDYGVDLFCSLAAPSGDRLLITDHYTVQVKSNSKPWKFETPDEVNWLVNHPSPLFLCVVDKANGVIALYQTFARFDVWTEGSGSAPLVLKPGRDSNGTVGDWDWKTRELNLSAPILTVSAKELFDVAVLKQRRDVLEAWLRFENKNILLRDAGLRRFRGPSTYATNSATFSGWGEKGLARPADAQLFDAMNLLGEAIDCVGSQLAMRGGEDGDGAFLAMLLLRWLTKRTGRELGVHPGISLRALQTRVRFGGDTYPGEGADRMIKVVLENAKSSLEVSNT